MLVLNLCREPKQLPASGEATRAIFILTMNTNIDSKEMVFAIIDEVGLDIDYIRNKEGSPAGRLYFTGIEVAIYVASGALASCFLGFAKGIFEEFGKEVGKGIVKEAGKAAGAGIGKAIIERLKGIVDRILKSTPESAQDAQQQSLLVQQQLDELIKGDLGKLVLTREAKDRELAYTYAITEVKTYLLKSGLTEAIATAHSERVVKVIKTKLSD